MSEPAQLSAVKLEGRPFQVGHDPRRWTNGPKPKKPRIADAFWRIANKEIEGTTKTELDVLCQAVWDKAAKGDSKCATLVFSRMEGNPVQPIEDVTPQAEITQEEAKSRLANLLARAAIASANAHSG